MTIRNDGPSSTRAGDGPPVVGSYAAGADHAADTSHSVVRDHGHDLGRPSPENRRDRVRWGPIWAGVLAVLTTFIVLQLLFFALGLLDLGFDGGEGSGTTAAVVTGVLALVAFFVGGLLAGASTMWRGAGDGLLHGVLVWALSVLGIITLALIGGSALLGPLAELAGTAAQSGARPPAVDVDPVQALSAARQSAGGTALGLGLAVAAAAIGGTVGSTIWPGRNTRVDHDGPDVS